MHNLMRHKMKIQRRITDDLTIELDLSGHALEFALQDGYTIQEQQTMVKCDVCNETIPEELEIPVFPVRIECPECSGEPLQGERCGFCHDRGRVDVCRECYNKSLKGEL